MLDSTLQEFDPNHDYMLECEAEDSSEVRAYDNEGLLREEQRRTAFTQDAPLFQPHTFWKNYMDSKREARKLERSLSAPVKRKWSEDNDDVEMVSVKYSSPSSGRAPEHGTKRKGYLPTPGPTPVKKAPKSASSDNGGRVNGPSFHSSDPFTMESDSAKLEKQREKHRQLMEARDPT